MIPPPDNRVALPVQELSGGNNKAEISPITGDWALCVNPRQGLGTADREQAVRF